MEKISNSLDESLHLISKLSAEYNKIYSQFGLDKELDDDEFLENFEKISHLDFLEKSFVIQTLLRGIVVDFEVIEESLVEGLVEFFPKKFKGILKNYDKFCLRFTGGDYSKTKCFCSSCQSIKENEVDQSEFDDLWKQFENISDRAFLKFKDTK